MIWFLPGSFPLNAQRSGESARELYQQYQVAYDRGDFREAEIILTRILEGNFSLPAYNLSLVYNALGNTYVEEGKYESALTALERAEEYCPEMNSLLKISIFNNQARIYSNQGDYLRAISYYDEGLRLLNELEADSMKQSKKSMLLFNKGIAWYRLGNLDEALLCLRESREIKETGNLSFLGSVYFNLARVYVESRDQDLANRYFRLSMEQWIQAYDSLYYQLANVYLEYGEFLFHRGKKKEALAYYEKALQNSRYNFGEKHPGTSRCYYAIGSSLLEEHAYRQAVEYFQRSLISVCPDFNDPDIYKNPEGEEAFLDIRLLMNYSGKIKALNGWADIRKDPASKESLLKAAVETDWLAIEVLERLQEEYLSRESRIFLNAAQKQLFVSGVKTSLKLYELTGEASWKSTAFHLVSHGKSMETRREMKEKELLYIGSMPDTLPGRIISLRKEMDALSHSIQTESQDLHPDPDRISSWKDRLFVLKREYDSVYLVMKEKWGLYPGQEEDHALHSVSQIRNRLDRNATVLEYFLSAPGDESTRELFIFTLSRKDFHVSQVGLDSVFISGLEIVRSEIHQYEPIRQTPANYRELTGALYQLYNILIHPVEPYIDGRELIIVPDEELGYIPFEALINRPSSGTRMDYAGLPYLLHQYSISYMYDIQQIVRKRSRKGSGIPVRIIVPEYSGNRRQDAPQLTGAREEAKEIPTLFDAVVYSGILTKNQVLPLLSQEGILHLAMHSRQDSGKDPASYLMLNDREGDPNSSRIYDYEINAMNISSPMVVLSACNTGSGYLETGEGLASLSRSFLLAGARSIVHTLWPLNDFSGSDIMVDYYRELSRGATKSRALQQAKQDYLQNKSSSFTHPYYWAGFQISGDCSPVKSGHAGIWTGIVLLAAAGFIIYFLTVRRSRKS